MLDGIVACASGLVGAEFGTVLLRRGDVRRFEASLAGERFVGIELALDTIMVRFAGELFTVNNDYDPTTSVVPEWGLLAQASGVTRCVNATLVQEVS